MIIEVMLTRLDIRNFQTHHSLSIDLDPRVTTIVGGSDSGKSAVVRALRWVALNKPNGKDFIRWGSKKTSVTVTAGRSFKIKRVRGKTRQNAYLVRQKAGNRKGRALYKAFGTKLPQPVFDLLKMTDANFQNQHDSPFWFCDSQAKVSKNLNEVVNLSLIDEVLTRLAALVRKTKEGVSLYRDDYREAKRKVKDLHYIPKMAHDLREAKKSIEHWQHLFKKKEDLRKAVAQAIEVKRAAQIEIPDISQLKQAYQKATESFDRIRKVKRITELIRIESEKVKRLRIEAEEAEQNFHKSINGQICPLCKQKINSNR